MLKKISLIVLIFTVLSMASYSAPLFPDVPADQWARDAVAQLAAKGLIEGYPDGTFKGDRYSTRWEVAMVLARLLAKTEQVESAFASKDDAETLKKLLVEYKEELEAFGVRVDALEKGYAVLDKRVDDLEKIKFYGNLDMLYLGQQVGGQLATAGQLNAFSVNDWTNGRPISNGRAVSAKSILGLVTNFDGIKSGAEFAGYYGYGDPAVDNYWGVTPQYFSNPFTAASGGGGVVSMNNPFSKLSFDNFWFKHEKSKIRAIAGTYNPELMNKHVLLGEPNPNINAPFILPFYGANVSGNFTWVLKNPVYYEIMYSRMPSASNAANPNLNYYQTPLISAAMGYDFKCGKTDGKLSFTVVNVNNDRITNGTVQAVGLINIDRKSVV